MIHSDSNFSSRKSHHHQWPSVQNLCLTLSSLLGPPTTTPLPGGCHSTATLTLHKCLRASLRLAETSRRETGHSALQICPHFRLYHKLFQRSGLSVEAINSPLGGKILKQRRNYSDYSRLVVF